jgi:general secretion pathway protein I
MSKLMTSMLNFNFPKRIKTSFNGFTLLEVMVSLSIIAIVLVSIIRLQGQTISMSESIRFYTIAPMLAQSRMSEITLDPFNTDASSSGDFGDDYPGYTWKSQVEELNINIEESPEIDLKKVDIFVVLNDGELQFPLSQYLNVTGGSGNE